MPPRLAAVAALTATLALGTAATALGQPTARPGTASTTTDDPAPAVGPLGGSATRAWAAPTLPAPSGPHRVGTTSLHLVDRSRHDPWVPNQPYRELMVSIRYPARDTGGHPAAPLMLPGEAAAYDQQNNLSGVPQGKVDWAAIRTHARQDAPIDRRGGRLPVVLYSPGAGDPRTLGSSLVDDLASRGYAVVTIDHTHEGPGVEFPGGRVERSLMLDEYQRADQEHRVPDLLRKITAVRVADTRFVLDELDRLAAGHNPDADHQQLPPGLRGALDTGRTAMFGQSAGGFTAAHTMHDDPRIKAAANMDGVMGYTQDDGDPSNPSAVGIDGLDRPLLLMGMEGDDHRTVASWDATWRHSSGWHRDLSFVGAKHASFTDTEALLPQLAERLDLPSQTVARNIGTIAPDRAIAAEGVYLTAFFDRWLLGRETPLLDGPAPQWPEVRHIP
ncbi:alpha/beta hydrolase family protein [Streptomyces palmae]|uniref:Hydrolase n=2 Tax=Streptomyces palmae TaxID=1701085 RepID=A0A4Z0HF75_9ACTN|nr:hydrolase [Streptomyces palmae]TGB13330.1 hydrolase [Streptomyces palmae]